MRKGVVWLLMVVLLAGCTQSPPVIKLPGELTAQAAGISSYNQFGFKLYQELLEQENILLSPLSIALALSMAYNGAAGETRAAMAAALLPAGVDLAELNQLNRQLIEMLQASDVTVEIANSLWLRQGANFLPDFISTNRTYYDAQASELDFSNDTAASIINGWVAEQTRDLIKEIVQNPLAPETLAMLLNAVYFQGDWTAAFAAENTHDGSFYLKGESQPLPHQSLKYGDNQTTVPFMNKTANFEYLETQDLQAVRLPYGKGNLAMYVFLPTDLEAFHQSLTQERWAEWRVSFESARGQLSLPKFRFEYDQELKDALTALGMGPAFDTAAADFSNMVQLPPGENAYISQVKHKAFIAVDEKGTEAAAVTSVEIMPTSMPPAPSFTMTVDRPFFFMIHDQQTDAILFMGSVYNPN